MGNRIREIILLGLLSAVLLASQVALAALPNIELVSLFIILFTLFFRRKVLYIIYLFALLEGLLYGFGLWWFSYLYVWTVLAGVTWLFRRMESAFGWALVSGAFGLLFGLLTSFTSLVAGGPAFAFSYFLNGIPFDLLHAAGNFAVCLLLFRPLHTLLLRLVGSPEAKHLL